MKKIITISKKPNISILIDKEDYVVWIGLRKKNGEEIGKEVWYLPTIEMCFSEIYEYLLKRNLSKHILKDLTEMKEIILETKKKILNIMKPLETL